MGQTPQGQAAPLQSFVKKFDVGGSQPQFNGQFSGSNPFVPGPKQPGSQMEFDPEFMFWWLNQMKGFQGQPNQFTGFQEMPQFRSGR